MQKMNTEFALIFCQQIDRIEFQTLLIVIILNIIELQAKGVLMQ